MTHLSVGHCNVSGRSFLVVDNTFVQRNLCLSKIAAINVIQLEELF